MTMGLEDALARFDAEHVGLSKGALSLVLILTRNAKQQEFPLDPARFETAKRGQVAGLGGGAVARILSEHGIDRVLSSEGGRTSRGNMERMRAYVALLNDLYERGLLDLDRTEDWWVRRVGDFFASQPFTFKLDPARSLRSCVRDLLSQATDRQRQARGTMYTGAVMQHLVGAKLDIMLGDHLHHHGFSVADAPSGRMGDFTLGEVVVHVTTAPTEALIRKCQGNLSSGLRPLIVTTEDGVGGVRALAKAQGVEDRVDVMEIEQFVATNLYEKSRFALSKPEAVKRLVERYNEIVSEVESDPSLKIEFEA